MGHETDPAAERAWVDGLLEGTTPGPWMHNWRGSADGPPGDRWHTHGPGGPLGNPRDWFLAAAAPDLAARYRAALGRLEAVEAERDRLARILAVDRGDESAAPEGWRCVGLPVWARDDGSEVSGVPGAYDWFACGDDLPFGARGTAPTALEAMEAADAARGGDDG